jgi:glycosyltransferase involved in cell wall biosynthesis
VRVAWFSPLPPNPSGIASYSAELLPLLDASDGLLIDRFVDRDGMAPSASGANVFDAHDFVWKQGLHPYDLVVYQLGNARWHDYMWAYLAAYPGLVVLHDTRLHHARARHLLRERRHDDYRREFRFNHPDAPPGIEEYAVEGLSGSIYYFWPMLTVVLRVSRLVAVHNLRVAAELRADEPAARLEPITMGVPDWRLRAENGRRARDDVRRQLGIGAMAVVFVAFGHVTAEKRIEPILRALRHLVGSGSDVHLVLVGPADGLPSLGTLIAREGLPGRVHVTGYVENRHVPDYLAAADACLCLRWPSAGETSASWLRALAAGKPTVITALAHLADVPTLDALTWRASHPGTAAVAIAVDLLDEEEGLSAAMARLAIDTRLRDDLGLAAHAHWAREHTLESMAADYRRLLRDAAAQPAPQVSGLPDHFTDDYSALVRGIADEMSVHELFETENAEGKA